MNDAQRQISSSLTGMKSQTGDISLERVLYEITNLTLNTNRHVTLITLTQ